MVTVQPPRISYIDWLDEGPLAPHGQAYKQYLIDRARAASTFGNCLGGVAHFVQWLGQRRMRVRRIDETGTMYRTRPPPARRRSGPASFGVQELLLVEVYA